MPTFGTTLGLELLGGAIPPWPRAWRASPRLRNLANETEARSALGSRASKLVIAREAAGTSPAASCHSRRLPRRHPAYAAERRPLAQRNHSVFPVYEEEVMLSDTGLIVPSGALLLPAVGGLMVVSFLAASAILLAAGYPAADLSLWAAE